MKQINLYDGLLNWEVYKKAKKLNRTLKTHPEYYQIWNDITVKIDLNTTPGGAAVYAKPYNDQDTGWYYLGDTPLHETAIPRGLSLIKLVKSGYEVQHDLIYNSFGYHDLFEPRHYDLHTEDEVPEGMVFAKGFKGDWFKTGSLPEQTAGDFWVDQYEVTNLQYQAFVDAKGYQTRSNWNFPFAYNNDTISWEEAMDRFRDQTGKPGPSKWIMGEFPPGEEQLPVSGISWFEAAAYAAYTNKELPTIYHWMYLAEPHAAPELVKYGNFEGNHPLPVGSLPCMTRYGTYDLPGNVTEWVFNAAGDQRAIIGGNFREASYFYTDIYYISPWTRMDRIGFRCMRYINDTLKTDLTGSRPSRIRDFSTAKPVSDEVFDIIKNRYRYQKASLNPRISEKVDSADWILESVILEVPYEDTPMPVQVYLPKNSEPPYQTVLFFPWVDVLYLDSMEDFDISPLEFFLKSGRAVIWPIYYGTFGRKKIDAQNMQTRTLRFTYEMIDFQIACDYLESREDIDMDRLAYAGISWGGFMAPYLLALEQRVKAGIVVAFGVLSDGSFPEYDQISYLSRVKIPMLMMNGKYDFDFTMETQQAFYEFLGTPEEDKVWKLYEHVHGAPTAAVVNESLAFLDKYFGTIKLNQ
jgi:hypothetical protein